MPRFPLESDPTNVKTPKKKILRSRPERISACESHLYFLCEDLKHFPEQYDRYKQIAGKLRILVCKTGTNKPLLLDLMDELGFTWDVQPPGPPKKGPITMPIPLIGWRDDPDFQAHARELQEAAGDKQKLASINERHNAKFRKSMPLRVYTDKAFATLIYSHEYSFRQLIMDVAQQCGSSHEDEAIDEPIAQMRSIRFGGVEQHVAVIIDYAQEVLDAGANFILYAVEKGLYKARHFKKKTG
jgi:hypothetical protein